VNLSRTLEQRIAEGFAGIQTQTRTSRVQLLAKTRVSSSIVDRSHLLESIFFYSEIRCRDWPHVVGILPIRRASVLYIILTNLLNTACASACTASVENELEAVPTSSQGGVQQTVQRRGLDNIVVCRTCSIPIVFEKRWLCTAPLRVRGVVRVGGAEMEI
jgi:hypothetical protein